MPTYLVMQSIMQLKKGVKKESKFLPTGNSLLAYVRYNVVGEWSDTKRGDAVVKVEKYGKKQPLERWRGKKNNLHEYIVDSTEGRNNKQSALFLNKLFDQKCLIGCCYAAQGKVLLLPVISFHIDSNWFKGDFRGSKRR